MKNTAIAFWKGEFVLGKQKRRAMQDKSKDMSE